MSQLIDGDTLYGTIDVTKQTGTVVMLDTEESYVEKDIELTLNVQSDSPAFDGGALTDKAATAQFTNISTSTSNTSGVVILAKASAGRAAVLYNGAVEGWVSADDNDTALAASSTENWNGTTYYATGVTLGNGKSFDITVPNGANDTITFHFSVDASGNTTVT